MRYDLLGRQTHTVDALGGVSYVAYDATGNRTLAQDELGHATYFFFDGLGRNTRVMDATLKSTYMGYDSRSSLVERIDADGRGTYMAYDVARRVERTFHTLPAARLAEGETVTAPTLYYRIDQMVQGPRLRLNHLVHICWSPEEPIRNADVPWVLKSTRSA